MKKLVASLIACMTLLVCMSSPAYAFNVFGTACEAGGGATACQNTDQNPIITTINKAIRIIMIISGIAGVIIMSVAGIMYATANGDAGKISGAKSAIIYTCVGLVIVVISGPIVSFVLERVVK